MSNKCHFIGIGGIGMSGLARILLKQNVAVSGSDLKNSCVTDNLASAGAKVFIGHSSHNITPDMTIVYSTDIKQENPEFQAALNLKCPMLHRSDLLLKLMQGHKTLAVAGSHGKTTTTALLTSVLLEAGCDPTFAVGGILPHLQTNADKGQGEYFVAEADESDGSFLKYQPWGAIITNVDTDHMDYYRTLENLCQAFKEFAAKTASESHLFWCGDDVHLNRLGLGGVSYGFGPQCKLRISHFRQDGWRIFFDVDYLGKHYADLEVALIGRHNALNSAAVFGMAIGIGISEEAIRKALRNFNGVGRRCEKKGEKNGIFFIDDYAHHPTEIKATLKAVREALPDHRLVAAFQPHRYSRTQDCLGLYKDIFDEADLVYVSDIYAAGELPIQGLSSASIMQELKQSSKTESRYASRENLAAEIASELQPHDIVISLGAGDITKLSSEIISCLNSRPIRKLKVGVLFGGRSLEHDISLLSAKNVIEYLGRDIYEIHHFGITKEGFWLHGDQAQQLLQGKLVERVSQANAQMLPAEVLQELNTCDVLFPVLHGPFGEDGTIQGFFEILGKPYVGCDYRGSAICMDKALTKKLMILNGVPTAAFVDFDAYSWQVHQSQILDQIYRQLTFPLFVKPVHLGSTIGVKKVADREDLLKAIEEAFMIDNHVLVENGLQIRELEFAVYGNGQATTFPPGEIMTSGEVYDYKGKYSEKATKTTTRASISDALVKESMNLALVAYKAAGCTGMARVDCFLDGSNKIWLNEINPIPGFTSNSLYPLICRDNGIAGTRLADLLIIMGMARWRQQKRITGRTQPVG